MPPWWFSFRPVSLIGTTVSNACKALLASTFFTKSYKEHPEAYILFFVFCLLFVSRPQPEPLVALFFHGSTNVTTVPALSWPARIACWLLLCPPSPQSAFNALQRNPRHPARRTFFSGPAFCLVPSSFPSPSPLLGERVFSSIRFEYSSPPPLCAMWGLFFGRAEKRLELVGGKGGGNSKGEEVCLCRGPWGVAVLFSPWALGLSWSSVGS